ncbi:MAG: DNA double-strand break repair nuclease NurA [Leptolyngbyaceae cyanobacterium MO_188.B28]|nr:DNA double-strand break repair nuclease NurA [Leptolyngbyaceae cyanobacterium MO_188.B28]
MSLKPSQIQAILQAKRADFARFDRTALKDLQQYRNAWIDFARQPQSERLHLLADKPNGLGGRPIETFAETQKGILSPQLKWRNREESLAWVRDLLTGVTTFAVDGSQIFPSKDFSIPVALVQIGWFENRHDRAGGYEKDIQLDVMTPVDLQAGQSNEPVDRRVNVRRFEMETQRLAQYIESVADPSRSLVFFDGSLIATFAEAFDDTTRQAYRRCLLALLRTSEKHRTPLVGYIDTSYAHDLTTLLQQVYQLPESDAVHDAQVLNQFMEWGDRTPLFQCERGGILDTYQEQRDQITFTYLKTTREGYPARLEIPRWIWEAGLLDQVVDWVRAEVIIGGGYPYVIETADQTAVLQTQDRQIFYRMLQDWAAQEGLNLRLSRKMVSKVRRR